MPISSTVQNCAGAILAAYNRYERAFKAITRRSKSRFEQRDWYGVQKDSTERLELYEQVLDEIAAEACRIVQDRPQDEEIWKEMKSCYAQLIAGRHDLELAETFYNSVTHRIITISGVNPETEFIGSVADAPLPTSEEPIYRSYYPQETTAQTIEKILHDCQFQADFENLPLDVELVTRNFEANLWQEWHRPTWDRIEILKPVFYRNKGAYVVGRVWKHNKIVPLMLPLLHTEKGISVDAVLMNPNEIGIVFFVGLYGPLRNTFFSHHGDLCGLEFWYQMQARQKAGEIIDVFPYKHRSRLRRDGVQP